MTLAPPACPHCFTRIGEHDGDCPNFRPGQDERLKARTLSPPAPQVHNHGPEDGPGLACKESRVNGVLRGECLSPPAPRAEPSAGPAEEFGDLVQRLAVAVWRIAQPWESDALPGTHWEHAQLGLFCDQCAPAHAARAAVLDHERRLRERVEELDELRETALAAVTEVRGIGQRYRNDWSDFDGRQLRRELNEATETLLSRIAAGTPEKENG